MTMTAGTSSRPSFGQALGETARLIKKLHDRAIAEQGVDFPTWMLLTVLTERGAAVPVPVPELAAELDRRLDLPGSEVPPLLERAAAAGDVTCRPEGRPATAELTEAGAAHLARTYAHARAATDRAFADIAPDRLEDALTVLLTAKAAAAAQLG